MKPLRTLKEVTEVREKNADFIRHTKRNNLATHQKLIVGKRILRSKNNPTKLQEIKARIRQRRIEIQQQVNSTIA